MDPAPKQGKNVVMLNRQLITRGRGRYVKRIHQQPKEDYGVPKMWEDVEEEIAKQKVGCGDHLHLQLQMSEKAQE